MNRNEDISWSETIENVQTAAVTSFVWLLYPQ